MPHPRWNSSDPNPLSPADASDADGTGAAAAVATSVTPLETGSSGAISWADPSDITVAVATHSNSGQSISFSDPLPPNAITLLNAAEEAWEAVANVHFVNTADTGTSNVSGADIRVGLASLSSMGFIGYTSYSYSYADNHFVAGTVVALDDVGPANVAALGNGNAQFVGFQSTVFQVLLHELGHALGLAHNTADATSIMYPTAGSANQYITSADATALRTVYGAPSASAVATAQADPTLLRLLPAGDTVTV